LLMGVLLALTLETLFRGVRSRALSFLAGRIDYLVGTTAFQKVLFLPVGMSENVEMGAQIAHLQDFDSIREFFTGPLGEALLDLPFVFLFLAVIAALTGWLVLVRVFAAITFLLCGFATAPLVRRAGGKAGEKKTAVQQFFTEAVSGMRAIKMAGVEGNWMERYRGISAGAAIGDFRVAMVNHMVQTISRIIMLAASIAMVGLGAQLVISGDATVGALVASMAMVLRCLAPFQTEFLASNKLSQVKSSLRQTNHLIKLRTEREPGKVPPLGGQRQDQLHRCQSSIRTRRRPGAQWCLLRRGAGRGGRHNRPQRDGQVHHRQSCRRPLSALPWFGADR